MRTILGLADLDRKLKRLPDVAKAHIKAAMADQAQLIVNMMQNLVPYGEGTLMESIGWTWGKVPKGSSVVAQVRAQLGSELTITIYAGNHDAYYARWVEFGTQKFQAQPYFYVSWRARKKGAIRAIRKATREAARRVAGS